jgi:competence protein ComEA
MRLAFRLSIDCAQAKGLCYVVMYVSLVAGNAWAQLPDGAGKAETQKLCSQCHELARSVSLRQDREGWQTTMNKMVALGTKGSEEDLRAVFEYLVKNFPADEVPPINVNKARAIELESGLTLRRSEAAAIIQYREKNGPFKSIDDLKKVPGVDAAKLEAKKDRLVF